MKKSIVISFLMSFALWNSPSFAQKALTLDDAIRIALDNNPSIKINQSQIKEADAKKIQAYSNFLPQAEVLSKYFYTNNTSGLFPLEGSSVPVMNNGTPTGEDIIMHAKAPFPILDRDVLTMDMNLIYTLYAGGKRKNALESTNALKEAYLNDLRETEGNLSLNVKTIFYNVLFLDELLKVYEETLNQILEHLNMAEKSYQEGVRSEFDVLMFKTKSTDFNSQLIELKSKKEIALFALKALLNFSETDSITCIGSIKTTINYSFLSSEQLSDSIDIGNNKMQSLKAMKKVLAYKEKVDKAENLPTLFTFGNYHIYHGLDTPPFDQAWRQGYAIGVGIKINLFDGNLSKGKVQETRAGIEKISGYEESFKVQFKNKYLTSVQHIQSLEAQRESVMDNIKVADKAYEIAMVGYKNNVITTIELNDTQLNITKVKIQLLNVEKDILVEQANLQYLLGVIY
ncbi:MAG: TolC family protein [Bacteroidia bacterium]|nr:TolC family protein [Bacteroidia bacterium]